MGARAHGLPAALALLAALAAPGRAAPPRQEAEAPARDARQLVIESLQARAKELMGELEDRMFQLSERLREQRPDDAARLVLALQRAREGLIVEEMLAIEEHLRRGELDQAAEGQRAVVARLEGLRRLLLSTDLDFLVRLERVRGLGLALEELEALAAESERIAAALAELGQRSTPDPADLQRRKGAALAAGEARETAERLASDVAELAGAESSASEELQQAAQEMARTEESLEGGDAGAAGAAQSRASEDLARVEEELRRARDELVWELQPEVRQQVLDALVRMREGLAEVRDGLRAVVGASAERQALAGEGPRRWGERLRAVEELGRETSALVVETDFSVHLGALLEWLDLGLEVSERGFEASLAGPLELAAAERAHDVLDGAIGVLGEEDERWRAARGDEEQRKRIKLLSELKGCRALQRVLAEDTAALDARRAADGPTAALAAEVATSAGFEARLAAMLARLDERYYRDVRRSLER